MPARNQSWNPMLIGLMLIGACGSDTGAAPNGKTEPEPAKAGGFAKPAHDCAALVTTAEIEKICGVKIAKDISSPDHNGRLSSRVSVCDRQFYVEAKTGWQSMGFLHVDAYANAASARHSAFDMGMRLWEKQRKDVKDVAGLGDAGRRFLRDHGPKMPPNLVVESLKGPFYVSFDTPQVVPEFPATPICTEPQIVTLIRQINDRL